MGIERRRFIQRGAAGLAGLGLLSWPGLAKTKKEPAAKKEATKTRPPTRVLGRTGITLPLVSMGVMNADNPAVVRAALDGGIIHLDTAHSYQGGRNEEMIGEVLRGRPREAVILSTKVVGMPFDRQTGLFTPATTGEALLEKFELSLKRLGTSYVDILYLHGVPRAESARFEPLLTALQKAKKDGKARFIGLTTHRNEPEVIRAAIAARVYDVVLTSYNFRQEHREEVGQAIAEAAAAGLGVIAMKTQAGVYFDQEKTRKIDMKAALRWVLAHPGVTTAIPGFTTFEQLAEDLEVLANPALSEAERTLLSPPQVASSGFFCDQCGRCERQCARGLPLPDLMRGYMYAGAYGNLAAAATLVTDLPLTDDPCQECAVCSVSCPKGIDVPGRARTVMGLRKLPSSWWV